MKSTFKPALLLMAGRMVAFATTFFVPIVLVRIFDQTEFGTYKQLFLIYGTLFTIVPCGMAESLFYFIPLAPEKGGRYAANSMIILTLLGLVCLWVLYYKAPYIARLLGNAALAPYIPWVGAFVMLSVMSAVLEIIMTSRKEFFLAASTYAISEMTRGAFLLLPVLIFRQLESLILGGVVFATLRLGLTIFYIAREFHWNISPDFPAFRAQLAYNLPFAAYALIEQFGSQFHQYAVSYHVSAAQFAIYAVGCLNIPLVELVHSPVSNVMMVRMTEEIRDGHPEAVLSIWHDTTRKLALIFFPLFGLLLTTAHEVIVFLFTEAYLASIPIFMVWSSTVLLPVIQTDGAMRVYAQTRFLLLVSIIKIVLIFSGISWFLAVFHLTGAALITIAAIWLVKVLSLARLKQLMRVRLSQLLPWKSLGLNAFISIAAGIMAATLKSHFDLSSLPLLLITGFAYAASYVVLALTLNLITQDERAALMAYWQRFWRHQAARQLT
jgi:O-antigen/teichoic acid export membrane protein